MSGSVIVGLFCCAVFGTLIFAVVILVEIGTAPNF